MASNKDLPAPTECKLCKHKALGRKWTHLIITGEKTSVDAASALKMSIEDVETHVYKHSSGITTVEKPKLDKEYFLVQLDDINCKLQEALEDLAGDEDFNARSLTSLTKEIRETLKLLAEVAGVIGADNSAAMNQQLNEMQQKYLTLTGLILEECCPDCQKKIVDRLKGEQNAPKAPQIEQ